MKKICISLTLFILIVTSAFGITRSEFNSIKVLEVFAVGNDLPKGEDWLPSTVSDAFQENLTKYTDFRVVNSSHKDQIINIQKESEGGSYDDTNSNIQVGKLTSASHGVFITVRKVSGFYSITLKLTDLTTSQDLVTIMNNKAKTPSEIYASNGCAIDLMTIDFCEQLGIPLTATRANILRYGDDDLTDTERGRVIDEDIDNYSKRLKDLDKEIRLVSNSTELNAEVKKRQLEAQRTLAEEKLKKAQQDKARAEEEAKRRREDEIKNSKREKAQRDRINEMSEEASTKVREIREKKLEELSILGQIKVIESYKQTYTEIDQKISNEEFLLRLESRKKQADLAEEIKNRPLGNTEKTRDGQMTDVAKENREREFRSGCEKIQRELDKDVSNFARDLKKEQKNLLRDIEKSYDNLHTRTITTLNDDLVVEFGNYDANDCVWKLKITVQSDDIIIFETTSELSYEALTGKKPVKYYGEDGQEEYEQLVDFYISMFSRGEPYLTFALDYNAKPLDASQPSKYEFNFTNLRIYETTKLKVMGDKIISIPVVDHMDMAENSVQRQMQPIWDLRDKEEVKLETVRKQEAYEKEMAFKQKKEDTIRTITETTENAVNYLKTRDWGRTQLCLNIGMMEDEKIGSGFQFEGEASFGIFPFLYVNYRADYLGLVTDKKGYYNANRGGANVFYNSFGVGGNAIIGNIELYIDYGLGFTIYRPTGYHNYNYINSGSAITQEKKQVEFITNLAMGTSYILMDHFSIGVGINYMMIPKTLTIKHGAQFADGVSLLGMTVGAGIRL